MTKTYYIKTELGVLTQRWTSLEEAMDACASAAAQGCMTAKVYEQAESGPDTFVYGVQLARLSPMVAMA